MVSGLGKQGRLGGEGLHVIRKGTESGLQIPHLGPDFGRIVDASDERRLGSDDGTGHLD